MKFIFREFVELVDKLETDAVAKVSNVNEMLLKKYQCFKREFAESVDKYLEE